MKKSKLLALISTFTETELCQFKEFVASPYFNKEEVLVRFAAYLEICAPDFPAEKVEKERVFAILFPGMPFDAKLLAYQMNYLLRLAERFLVLQQAEQQPLLGQYQLLTEYLHRRLDKHFSFTLGKARKELEGETQAGPDYFYYQYHISELASDFDMMQGGRKLDPAFQIAADSLDDFYFLNKLKFSCEMLNRQKIFSAEYELRFLDEVTAYLGKRETIPPIIDLYLQTYQTMENPVQEEHFTRLMDLLREHGQRINREELRRIYLYAINYSVRNISRGYEEYIPIALALYQEGIRSRALFENEFLTHATYTNVIKLALMQRRFDWIETFINDYSDYLNPKFKDDALHYNLAELYYHRRDFGRVLDHLNQLQFSDIQYHLGSRVVLIKTYYELDEIESLLSLLAAFSVFLRRNKKISTPLKKRYLNFCNLLHHILRRDDRKRERLDQQIKTVQPLAERAWLMEVFQA